MGEESPESQGLGLDRLSPHGIVALGMFIHSNVDGRIEERLGEVFSQELHSMPDRDLAIARIKLEELASSEYFEDRQVACDLVPYIALADPDLGYAVWSELMRDSDGRVAEEAATTLARHLGVCWL